MDGSQDLLLTILRVATHETERRDHDFCLSRSHYTDMTQSVGSGWSEWGSNPQPPRQESHALPTEPLRPSAPCLYPVAMGDTSVYPHLRVTRSWKVGTRQDVCAFHTNIFFKARSIYPYLLTLTYTADIRMAQI